MRRGVRSLTSRVDGVTGKHAGKGNSEMVNDGKFICKRFFSNFEKLKREVESEEAFFFNDDGVYCQVGTSIFDRWEQVTLIDPEWVLTQSIK